MMWSNEDYGKHMAEKEYAKSFREQYMGDWNTPALEEIERTIADVRRNNTNHGNLSHAGQFAIDCLQVAAARIRDRMKTV